MDPQLQDSKSCDSVACPVHCELSDWSLWTLCSKTCGGGISSRSREEKVAAAHGGDLCVGATSQDQARWPRWLGHARKTRGGAWA